MGGGWGIRVKINKLVDPVLCCTCAKKLETYLRQMSQKDTAGKGGRTARRCRQEERHKASGC